MLLKRIVLYPTPPEGSKLSRTLGDALKQMIKADMSVENGYKGLLTPTQRNYIIARGMQVPNDKEL